MRRNSKKIKNLMTYKNLKILHPTKYLVMGKARKIGIIFNGNSVNKSIKEAKYTGLNQLSFIYYQRCWL